MLVSRKTSDVYARFIISSELDAGRKGTDTLCQKSLRGAAEKSLDELRAEACLSS